MNEKDNMSRDIQGFDLKRGILNLVLQSQI